MSETANSRSDHCSDTEAKEDSNNARAKEIWKESLVDASGNPIEPQDKEEVEAGEEAREVEEGETPPGVKPELQYSREELYEIQKHSLSQIKPDFLDRYPIQARFSFVKGVWERNTSESGGGVGGPNSGGPAPSRAERWVRSVTPNENEGFGDNKMRRGENRMSRGKDQQQDASLVLSPQRRSFNSGCYITGGGSLTGAREGKTMDRESMGQSQGQPQGRRFGGSGRVSWTDPATGLESTTFVAPNLMPDYTQRRDGGPGGPPAQPGGGGFERRYGENKRINNRNSGDYNNRSNGDYHRNSGGDYNRNGGDYNSRNNGNDYSAGGRYSGMNGNDRRRNNSDRNHNSDLWDEPEWFTGGPTSQNDVIDLHGFQDEEKEVSPEKNRKSSSNSDSERGPRKSSSSSSGGAELNAKDPNSSSEGRNSRTEERAGSGLPGDPLKFGREEGPNLDDLLNNLDTFPDLLTNGSDAAGDTSAGGSRFSRWFRKESPVPPESAPSPHHMINDLINDITDENRAPNSNAEGAGGGRFAPVSPVFPSQPPRAPHPSAATSHFLDMMLRTQQDASMRSGSMRDLEGVGKLHSVEELEAKIRHPHAHPHHPHAGSKEEDMANFKKLLAKSIDSKKPPDTPESALASGIGTSNHVEPPSSDPSFLPQMMSKLLQQQQLAQNLQQLGGGGNPWGNLLAAQNSSNYQELVHKMLKIQQAQDYQRRMAQLGMANNQQGGGFLPPHHSSSPVPPEIQHHLLNNPQFDARNLIRPTVGASPLSPPSSQQAPPPSIPSPGGPGPSFLQPAAQPGGLMGTMPPTQAAQQFMLGATGGATHSPGGPGNSSVFQQRIPSPNQLAAHTQTILQNAILKKKMEEQKEAMRKRQELLQRAGSPSSGAPLTPQYPHGHPQHPAGLAAFTPTSVLRKMTAHPHPHPHEAAPGAPQHEKDLILNHSQGGGSPWPQQPSLGLKNNLMNLGNQQISSSPAQSGGPYPRSKFTLSSKLSSKSSGHVPQSLAEQMSMMSQESNLKSPAQHANPFAPHHSQAGAAGMPSSSDQLEKWFSPEFLARARAQGPPPAHNLMSVEELERHPPSQPPPPSAGAVQH